MAAPPFIPLVLHQVTLASPKVCQLTLHHRPLVETALLQTDWRSGVPMPCFLVTSLPSLQMPQPLKRLQGEGKEYPAAHFTITSLHNIHIISISYL